MWNKLSQAAGFISGEGEDEKKDASETQDKLEQQQLINQQLKDLLRENENHFVEKEKELEEVSSKFRKFKLQSKAKITQLANQLKGQEKDAIKEEYDLDDASSSDSSDQSRRGQVIVLKKQLDQAKQQIDQKNKELSAITQKYEKIITNFESQLKEKTASVVPPSDKENIDDDVNKKSINAEEMYAHIVYKDAKILELDKQILEYEKKILDLQENLKEKDEVLQQRNRAVQLIAADMSEKSKSLVSELDETRSHMRVMQENFVSAEDKWHQQIDQLNSQIKKLEKQLVERDEEVKNCESLIRNLDNTRFELLTKNTELQKQIVLLGESIKESSKNELASPEKSQVQVTTVEKLHGYETENPAIVTDEEAIHVLKEELNALRKDTGEKHEEISQLQLHVVELEEEKGSLQLKVMEIEEQIMQQEKLEEENESLRSTSKGALEMVTSLEAKINEINAEKLGWKQRFEILNEKYNHGQNDVNTLNKENVKLKEKLTEVSLAINNLEEEYKNLIGLHCALENEYSDTSQELNMLKDEKITFEMKVIELEEMRESDENIINELVPKFKEIQKYFSDAKEVHFKPDTKCNQKQLVNESFKRNIESIIERLLNFHQENKLLNDRVFKKDVEVSCLKDELDILQSDFKQSSGKMQKLCTENIEYANEIKNLKLQLESLQSAWSKSSEEVKKLEEEHKRYRSENLLLNEQLKSIQCDFSKSIDKILCLNSENEQYSSDNESLTLQLKSNNYMHSEKRLHSIIDLHENENMLLNSHIDSFQNEITALCTEIENYLNENNLLKSEMQSDDNILKQRNGFKELRQNKNILEKSRLMFDEMYNSVSGKLSLKSEVIDPRYDFSLSQNDKTNRFCHERELLTSKMKTFHDSINKSHNEAQDLRKENAELFSKYKNLIKQIQVVEKDISDSEKEFQKYVQYHLGLTDQLTSVQDDFCEVIDKITWLNLVIERYLRSAFECSHQEGVQLEKFHSEIADQLYLNNSWLKPGTRCVDLPPLLESMEKLFAEVSKNVDENERTFQLEKWENKQEMEKHLQKCEDSCGLKERELKPYLIENRGEIFEKSHSILRVLRNSIIVHLYLFGDLESKFKAMRENTILQGERLRNLYHEKELLITKINCHQEAVENFDKKFHEIKTENIELLTMCENLKHQFEQGGTALVSEESTDINLSKQNVHEKSKDYENLKDKILQLEKTVEMLSNENTSLSINVEDKLFLIQDLTAVVAGKDNTINRLTEEQHNKETSMDQMYREFQQTVHQLENENQQLKQRLNEYLSQLQSLESSLKTYDNLQHELSTINAEKGLLQQQLATLTSEMQAFVEEKKCIGNKILKLQEEKNELVEINRTVSHALAETKQLLLSQELDFKAVSDQNDKNLENYETLCKELDHYKLVNLEVNKLQNELSTVNETKTFLQQHLDSLTTNMKSVVEEKSSLENKVLKLEDEKNDLAELNRTLSTALTENEQLMFIQEVDFKEVSEQNNKNLEKYQTICKELDHYKAETVTRINTEEKILQDCLDSLTSEMKAVVEEKSSIENKVLKLQEEKNDLVELNTTLSNALAETKQLLLNQELNFKEVSDQNDKNLEKYETLCKELDQCKLVNVELSGKVQQLQTLENSLSLLKHDYMVTKQILESLGEILSSPSCDNLLIYSNLHDEALYPVIHNLENQLKSLHLKVRTYCENIDELNAQIMKISSENKTFSEQINKYNIIFNKCEEILGINDDDLAETSEVVLDDVILGEVSHPSSTLPKKLTGKCETEYLQKDSNATHMKYIKMLTKLKRFEQSRKKEQSQHEILKVENEKLNSSLKEYETLCSQVNLVSEPDKSINTGDYEKGKLELAKLRDIISELKHRNCLLDNQCSQLQQELQEYKYSWEQSNISYELQKEDNERLREKLKRTTEQVESLVAELPKQNDAINQLQTEKYHLQQELQNSQDQANMLFSDNENYQNLIGKMKISKMSLEGKLNQTKDVYEQKIKNMEQLFHLELENFKTCASAPTKGDDICNVEAENLSLKERLNEVQITYENFKKEHIDCFKEISLLKKEKSYLQRQLLERKNEIDKMSLTLSDKPYKMYKNVFSYSDSNIDLCCSKNLSHIKSKYTPHDINEVANQNKYYKSQLKRLTEELHHSFNAYEDLKQEGFDKETTYENVVCQLQVEIQALKTECDKQTNVNKIHATSKMYISSSADLRSRILYGLSILHNQGFRCEEFNTDITKVLQEKENLICKLQEYQQQHHIGVIIEDSSKNQEPIKIETQKMPALVPIHDSTLIQYENTCQELRKANESLDQALISERNQRKALEEELLCLRRYSEFGMKSDDEYRILIDDNEPNVFPETTLSVDRRIKANVYEIFRWLRGRRNYLCRIVKTRNYKQLLCVFYVIFVHIWLFTCIF